TVDALRPFDLLFPHAPYEHAQYGLEDSVSTIRSNLDTFVHESALPASFKLYTAVTKTTRDSKN
ncbi:hypothetical protein ABTD84_19575, partial [Acinetobacter baumannii]